MANFLISSLSIAAVAVFCCAHRTFSSSGKFVIRATSRETLIIPYANKKGADQPTHPRSLISAIVFAA